MELRQLRYFVAVAETLHFGRAAERLGITQPPLSQQIRALEDAIGARLFNRTNRRVELTDAGRAFLTEIRPVLEKLDAAAELAARAHRGEVGELLVGFTISAPFTTVFSRALYAYRRLHPGVALALSEMTTLAQIDALMERRLHVGVIRPSALPEPLEAIELLREPMVIALHADHRLAHGDGPVSLDAFAGDDFVLFPRTMGIGLYDQIIALCRHAGFAPRIAQEARHASTQIALVAAGFGVAILPALQQRIQVENVVYRTLADADAHTAVWLVYRSAAQAAPLRAFVELVREEIAREAG
ncbi:LysR family transcriptional regulator [Crenobacter cavernae]|uniref:LysR family transcriptional regulator n=1 Tax=Crenobacter cavernae TaxID=2290923 RepID=A0ABY0FCP9_9NEIS|nr:LysR family transcriptional regulator [Crenobacter cavernae]RXZ43885.1 LysR family transcriptional regulator [Crenobacter cavernae]